MNNFALSLLSGPSVITLNAGTGCPAGHIRDIRGECKRVFQYTVNYGTPSIGRSPFSRSSFMSRPTDFLWTPFNRASKSTRRKTPLSIRDLIKSSSLFKKSQKKQILDLSAAQEEQKSTKSKKKSSSSSSGEVKDKKSKDPQPYEYSQQKQFESNNYQQKTFDTLGYQQRPFDALFFSDFLTTSTPSPITTTTEHDD